ARAARARRADQRGDQDAGGPPRGPGHRPSAQRQRSRRHGHRVGRPGGGRRGGVRRTELMITRLTLFSIARRRAVLAATASLALLALVPALNLPLDALPDLTNNQVVVLTSAPGFSPEEVERTVTRPLEVALSGLPGLEEQRSIS